MLNDAIYSDSITFNSIKLLEQNTLLFCGSMFAKWVGRKKTKKLVFRNFLMYDKSFFFVLPLQKGNRNTKLKVVYYEFVDD